MISDAIICQLLFRLEE
jgi:hypothetical protein